jgi:CheY-like chemotaxis protein
VSSFKILLIDNKLVTVAATVMVLNECLPDVPSDIERQIDVAPTAEAAIDFVMQQNYDLIFMDIDLPDMLDGKVAEIIRAINPNIPIVALTARNVSTAYDQYFNVGIKGILASPLTEDNLFVAIHEQSKLVHIHKQNIKVTLGWGNQYVYTC